MKRPGFFLAVAFCVSLMGGVVQGQELLIEHFNYATGQLTSASGGANVSGGNWVTNTGTGFFIPVSAGSLSYPNYLGSVGNKIDIVSTTMSAEDTYRQFATQASGTTYAGFLVNVANTTGLAANASTTGDYFAGFIQAGSTTIFADRICIKLGTVAGTYQLGLRASSNATAVFSPTNFTPGTTVLIVFSYQIVAGATNDVANMWINPPLGGSQPAADVTQTSASDLVDIGRFFVRQGNAGTPNASIDTIRVGMTWSDVASSPTAADGVVSGRIADANGAPVAGAVVRLSGSQTRKTITDANGNYLFEKVETNGFYTVAPSRANYSFSPAERSFSQLGNSTEATFTGTRASGFVNPLDTPEYFVRQHYLDFLGREPDEAGFNFWSDQLTACGADAACLERRTINVSAAYFISVEFQKTGALVDRLYKASYGRSPLYAEFMPDRAAIARDVVVGRSGWEARLAANTDSFIADWVERAAFHAAYDGLANDDYVDALVANTGVSYAPADRNLLVSGLNTGAMSRAAALKQIANNENFASARFNEAFVTMEYFGYLRRDGDRGGLQFWLNKLNEFDGNFERAEMVRAFIVSGEYRARFGQ